MYLHFGAETIWLHSRKCLKNESVHSKADMCNAPNKKEKKNVNRQTLFQQWVLSLSFYFECGAVSFFMKWSDLKQAKALICHRAHDLNLIRRPKVAERVFHCARRIFKCFFGLLNEQVAR